MKKMSLRLRLTCLSALILTISCIILNVLISNSALMKMDKFENDMMGITINIGEDDFVLDFSDQFEDVQKNIESTKTTFRIQCIIITVVIIVLGTVLTWIIAGIALKPLKKLNTEISAISESNLSTQIPEPKSKDEISELTNSFNHMLFRLDNAFSSQQKFIANAAHELRTPVAVMQTNLEVFQKKNDRTIDEYNSMINTILGQTEHLSNLSTALLDLMSLHTATIEDNIDLYDLTDEIICDLQPLADKRNISISHEGENVSVKCNEVLMYRAIYNLVENSIKYNKDNGKINVSVTKSDKTIRISVADTGKGIPKEHWGDIFNPFYRVDKARSRSLGGAGLGLALVHDIISVHSGTVYIKDSSSEGTVICIDLQA